MESKDPGKERTSPATPVGGSRRPSSGSGSGGRKRGHHRRARKHWRSSNEDRGRSRRGSGNGGNGGPGRHQNLLNRISSNTSGSAASHSSSGAPIYLRPTNCPPAPRNSTQFIIDDHGGSGSSRSNNASPAGGASASAAAAPSSSSFAEDGDSQWAERDFQSVYETAHREEVSAWDRKRLCEEISALERRQKELVKVLARIDPEVYLQRLEAQVASLRETGARLKAGLRRAKETAAAADTSNLSSPDPSAIVGAEEPPP